MGAKTGEISFRLNESFSPLAARFLFPPFSFLSLSVAIANLLLAFLLSSAALELSTVLVCPIS